MADAFSSLLFLLLLPRLSFQENLSTFSVSDSPWTPSQNRTLVSTNSTFAAGFRPLPSSPNLFLFSVWYQADPNKTILWSNDKTQPVSSSSALVISVSGLLSLNDSSGKNLLPGPSTRQANKSLLLSDDGNLIFGNWSSFDYPTDTCLPNQLAPLNGTTLSSGSYKFVNASTLVFNSVDDYYWSSSNKLTRLTTDGQLVKEGDNNNWISADAGTTLPRRLTLDSDGNLRLYSLDPSSRSWTVVWRAIHQICQVHGTCGPNFICKMDEKDAPSCVCPPGFFIAQEGNCQRKRPLSSDNKFLRLDYVNFSGKADQDDQKSLNINLAKCQSDCLANRNCSGFGYKFDGTRNCVHQTDRLLNGYWSPGTQAAFFLRVDTSETDTDISNFTGMTTAVYTTCPVRIRLPPPPKESKTTARNVAIAGSVFAVEVILGALSFWAFLRKYSMYRNMARTLGLELLPAGGPKRFSYEELKAATNNFTNVVGHGGFGVVYRGELPDHRLVAVKSLKNVDHTAEAEFWAEVAVIARMHHLNLVRLWGFCAEKGQRLLVYEYISNGSLDKHLFKPSDNGVHEDGRLSWDIRFRIAVGVARAIAYLHEECLEWVLHCDIKPENILLGDDFCPKVSDFGLSKLTNKKEKMMMSRLRGTPGYMAPEWVTSDGPITAKADVFSFGMVLLEMVSGMRNRAFTMSETDSQYWYFPKWAFEKVYEEKRVEGILDSRMLDMYDRGVHLPMVDRMVKTAMWCVQDRPEMRPSMGKVAKMLEGTVDITDPMKPTIFFLNNVGETESVY